MIGEFIYIHIYIYIYILKWVRPPRDLHFLWFIYLFCSYIYVCFQLDAFVREHVWYKTLLMEYLTRLELTRVCSLNGFQLVMVFYVHLQCKIFDICKICDLIIEGKSFTFKNPETKFKIIKDLSCNSKNVVYIIECSECKEISSPSCRTISTDIPGSLSPPLQSSIASGRSSRLDPVSAQSYCI